MGFTVFLAAIAVAGCWAFRSSSQRTRPTSLMELDLGEPTELAEFVSKQYRGKPVYYEATLASGESIAIGLDPEAPEWLDIITRKRKSGEKGGVFSGPYDVFGFSVNERRWSYGEGPPGAGEIRGILHREFGVGERVGRFQR